MKSLMSDLAVLALAATAAGGDVSLDLKVSDVKAFKADKPGTKTCEFTAELTVKNNGKKGHRGEQEDPGVHLPRP